MELTEVDVRGEAWWSLGFEATGPAGALPANSMPPPRSCLPRPCRAGWNWAWMTLRPTRSGCANGSVPKVLDADPDGGLTCLLYPGLGDAVVGRRMVGS